MRYLIIAGSLLQVALLAVLIFFIVGFNKKLDLLTTRLADRNLEAPPGPARVNLAPDPQAPSMGSDTAKVKMVVFSDFECGFCKTFAVETLPKLKADFVDKGLLRIEFRDLPLDMHKNAPAAAEAGACANEQGRFWELHDLFFHNQQHLSDAYINAAAQKLSLDEQRFTQCLESHRHKAGIDKDMEDARAQGITGTPTIIINGNVVLGSRPYDQFTEMINSELGR